MGIMAMSLYKLIPILSLCILSSFWNTSVCHAISDKAQVLSVNPGVWSTLSGNRMSLKPRMDVPIKAVVQSDFTGNAQLMFPDDSTITISPGTEIELAEFVDEPRKENIVVDLAVGTARVITGEVSRRNPNAFTVTTPQAVIGIRGTVATVMVIGNVTRIYLSETSGLGVSVRNRHTGTALSMRSPGAIIKVTPTEISEHMASPGEVKTIVALLRGPAINNQEKRRTAQELRHAARVGVNPGAALSSSFLIDTDMASTTIASVAERARPAGPAVPGGKPVTPTPPVNPPSVPSVPAPPTALPSEPSVPAPPVNPPSVPSVPDPPSIPEPLPPSPAPDVPPGPDAGNYVVNLPLLAGTFTGGGSYVNNLGAQSNWDISMKVPDQYALKDKDLIKIVVNGHFWGAQWADPGGFGTEFTLKQDGSFGLANPGSVNISGQFTSNNAGSVTVDSSKVQWKPDIPNNDQLYPGGVVSGPITKQ